MGPQRTPCRSLLVAVLVLVVALGVAGCVGAPAAGSGAPVGSGGADVPGPPEITAGPADRLPAGTPGDGTPAVVLGTKDFSEQFLLGELYTQALRAKGYTITLQQNVGPSELIDTAFAADQIQMYPEYLGEVASGPGADTPLGIHRVATQFAQSRRAATVLKQTPYQNTDVLVTTRAFAESHGLRTVADLASVGRVRLAAQPPFRTRTTGLVGLENVYGLTDVDFLAVSPGVTYEALDAGLVDVAGGFSTDAQLRSGDYVQLEDPKRVSAYQYLAPLVKQETLRRAGPGFAQTCNWVSSLLTVDAIRTMNEQVQLGGANEAQVAREFLASKGLR